MRESERRMWWTGVLRGQGMPPEEIRAVLAAEDPEIVRRHLELHRERLEERLTEQRRVLARLEEALIRGSRLSMNGIRGTRAGPPSGVRQIRFEAGRRSA